MARVELNFNTDFLDSLKDIDKYASKMIEKSSEVVVKAMKKSIENNEMVGTGEMVASVEASKPKYDPKHGGHWSIVRPRGNSDYLIGENGKKYPRSSKLRNMEKLVYMEYGRSGQKARPIIAELVEQTEEEVIQIMQQVYEQEAGI